MASKKRVKIKASRAKYIFHYASLQLYTSKTAKKVKRKVKRTASTGARVIREAIK